MMDSYLKWFEAFVARHQQGELQGNSHISLKRTHSLHVLEHAAAIAEAELHNGRLQYLAKLAGLFHDVGRFPQYAQYHTFKDDQSVNHGHLGSRVLRRFHVLKDLDPAGRRAVLGAVHMHNRRYLPKHLPKDVRTLTDVVRDADKLDILRVMLGHFDGDGADEVVVLHVQEHPTRYTPEVLESALNKQSPDYRSMQYVNDFKILLLNWAFELNYPSSRHRMLESGNVERILAHLPEDPGLVRLGALVTAHLAA